MIQPPYKPFDIQIHTPFLPFNQSIDTIDMYLCWVQPPYIIDTNGGQILPCNRFDRGRVTLGVLF